MQDSAAASGLGAPHTMSGTDPTRRSRDGVAPAATRSAKANSARAQSLDGVADHFADNVLSWLARQWAELGVSRAVRSQPIHYAVSVEELVILTAELGDRQPSLRAAALDWCSRSGRLLCKPRLKTLLAASEPETKDAFGPFSTTLARHLAGNWPGQRLGSVDFTPSSKQSQPDLSKDSLLSLKLRSLFGVGARADLIFATLCWPAPAFVASELTFVGYTKRNVATALDALADAGILRRQSVRNRVEFSWQRRSELLRLLGPVPKFVPRWPELQRIVSTCFQLLVSNEGRSARLSMAFAESKLQERSADFQAIGVEPFSERLAWYELAERLIEESDGLKTGRSKWLRGPGRIR